MPTTTTLRPAGTDSSEFATLVGPTVHQALSDDSDASYVQGQVSPSPSQRAATGDLADLPAGAGIVESMVLRIRGNRSTNPGDAVTLAIGDQNVNNRFNVASTGTITTYTSGTLTPYTLASQINSLKWWVAIQYGNNPGVVGSIYEAYYDVTWDPVIGGFRAMILQYLGWVPVAIGLAEIPRLTRHIAARFETRIPASDHRRLWEELLAPHRVYA